MKAAVRVSVVGSHDLPEEYCAEIGRAIVKFAYLEQYLKRVPFAMLKLTPEQGMTAIRSPRMSELMDMISDLEGLSPCGLPTEIVASLKTKLAVLEKRRDLLAHSGWVVVDGLWHLVNTKGTWQKQAPKDFPQGKRALTPEFERTPIERLKSLCSELDQAISEARKLGLVFERKP